jgi:hypothetical protein
VNILLQAKQEVEKHFGKQSVIAPNLLAMVAEGEQAFGFLTGDMSQGFDVTVGFFGEKARYVAFKKRSGTTWAEGDVRAVLMSIGRLSNWTRPAGEFFDYAEKNGDQIVAEATGWHTATRRYAFAYIPTITGGVTIIPDKTALDQKFPT